MTILRVLKKKTIRHKGSLCSLNFLARYLTYQASHRIFNSYRSQQGVTSTSCYVFQIIDLDPNEDIELSVWMYKLLEDRYWHSWNLLRRGKNPLKRLLTIPKSIASLVDWTFSVRHWLSSKNDLHSGTPSLKDCCVCRFSVSLSQSCCLIIFSSNEETKLLLNSLQTFKNFYATSFLITHLAKSVLVKLCISML